MATHEEILAKIQEILADALGADEDEVSASATLVGDLGAESIDFLDIVFNLEKIFEIKIKRGELFPENLAAEGDGLAADGVVTEDGLAKLRERLPFADIDAFAADPQVENIQDLFTVEMLVKFVAAKQEAGE